MNDKLPAPPTETEAMVTALGRRFEEAIAILRKVRLSAAGSRPGLRDLRGVMDGSGSLRGRRTFRCRLRTDDDVARRARRGSSPRRGWRRSQAGTSRTSHMPSSFFRM